MRQVQNSTPSIAIIGAGLTGLSCAYHLEQNGLSPVIYERKERPGGRIYSDHVDGYTLDRGFQVLLTSYPEFKEKFTLKNFDCELFDSGALIRHPKKGCIPLYNPRFHPLGWAQSTTRFPSQMWSFVKLFREYIRFQNDPHHWPFGILTTEELLQHLHISPNLINCFFRPFFGGVFLENELHTQAPVFMRRFHHFLWGQACLPKGGMRAVPLHLASLLKKTRVHYHSEVTNVDNCHLKFADGTKKQPDIIICCLESSSAKKLFPMIPCQPMVGVTCLYFSIDANKVKPQKLIMLGNHDGPINNLSIDSAVQPSYAPKGKHLISATVVDQEWQNNPLIKEKVCFQIHEWLNIHARHLRTYHIKSALPSQAHPPPLVDYHHPRLPHVYLAGELVDSASLNRALASGKKTAYKILNDLVLYV